MSKQVSFNLPKTEWPGPLPPHIAEKWGPEQLSTIVSEGYYGKKVLQEDDLPSPLFRLKPCPDFISPFTDMEPIIVDIGVPRMKPFHEKTKEAALARVQKNIAMLDVELAQHQLEIAGKLEMIESTRTTLLKEEPGLVLAEKLRIQISIWYCQIEIEKLLIKQTELEKGKLQDKWQEIQHWTE